MENPFIQKTPIQIRFSDIDLAGHINNARYHTYIESGRMDYFEKALGFEIDWKKTGIILARTEMDYLFPGRLNDKISVHTSCSKIGTKSFYLYYEVIREGINGDLILAKATTILVCFDYFENKTIEIPEQWKEKLLRKF